MPERVGQTVQSELSLRPGSVTVLAVTRAHGVPAEAMAGELAAELGYALGAVPEYVGQTPAGWQYVIGQARPVTIRLVPVAPGSQVDRWYRRVEPVPADDPIVAAVHLDWRGETRTLTWPAAAWHIPRPETAVYGAHSWPDGTASEQRERIATEQDDAELSRLAASVRSVSTIAGRVLGGSGLVAAGGLVAGLVGALAFRRLIGGR